MTRKGWYEALANALRTEQKNDTGSGAVLQIATIHTPSGTPRVRTLRQRAFITASTLPNLPLILATTDIRTRKVTQLDGQSCVELAYWVPSTVEQFRILGRASIIPRPGYQHAYPKPTGVVFDELEKEGFDWEEKRTVLFDQMNGYLKAGWCRPTPGTPLKGGEDEMKKWPEELPKWDDAKTEEDKKNLETALSNFALLLIEPFEVDYMEYAVLPNRRTLFKRNWEDEASVEFEETWVMP